jgi:LPS export ABC transporter permease LptG
MKILSRHLLSHHLRPFSYLLISFTLLFVVADVMNNGEDFYHQSLSFKSILAYYQLQLPSMLVGIIPICLLLATLYSFSVLTRHHEITAMRASGMSLFLIIRPYLFVGILGLLITAAIHEWIQPSYTYRAAQILQANSAEDPPPMYNSIPFRNVTLGHAWFIEKLDPTTEILYGITLTQERADGSSLRKIKAEKGRYMDHCWWFEEVQIQRFNSDNTLNGLTEHIAVYELKDLPETPADFIEESRDTNYLSSWQLARYIQEHPYLSDEVLNGYRVDLHRKLITPFLSLLAVLLGIPVGMYTGRQGAIAGILRALGLFFGYYFLQFIMEYLARIGFVDPVWGAWGTLLAFLLLALFCMRRDR